MAVLHVTSLMALLACHVMGATTPPSGESATDDVEQLKAVTRQLGRQLMLQQLYVEEMTRSQGDSGLKQTRMRKDGTKPYYVAGWASGRSMAAIHDHSDLVRTCGMGELDAVLNGVEFRTRHNDYKLRMPSTNSSDYHAMENIPFPPVPPEVLSKATVDEQVAEMREWFKAWKEENTTVRDYRKYFKANLCYLEGAWTSDLDFDEPFESDRHHIEAESWFDLQEKIRFTSATGDKNNQENFAYLPTTVMALNGTAPIFGQWNYRILCHPIKDSLPLSHIKPIDNLAVRLTNEHTWEEYLQSRTARFQVNPLDKDDSFSSWKIDELMGQIPGKDNYLADITDNLFGLTKFKMDNSGPLNTGFYNRWYRVREEGAMGSKTSQRGFADRNLFVADTTQSKVAPVSVEVCKKRGRKKTCQTVSKRVSYAIPLEIVYMTPLHEWNPFDIEFKSGADAAAVSADGRNGRKTPEKALNGTRSKDFYITPFEFFSGDEVGSDSADSARGSVGVLDRQGNVRSLKASGVRILLPEIKDVGVLRTRFPIMPVHAEGSPVWKELEALRDVVMNMQRYLKYFQTPPGITVNDTQPEEPQVERVLLATSSSNPTPVGLHSHVMELTQEQVTFLKKKRKNVVGVRTTEENGHSHFIEIRWSRGQKKFVINTCDERSACFDGHSNVLETRTDTVMAP